MKSLCQLQQEIDVRVAEITDGRQWPCGKGCDPCCHRLAEIPLITEVEWQLLQAAFRALPDDVQLEVDGRVRALALNPERPLACPLLDSARGQCRIYAARPIACRTYGFYVQRGQGLYCRHIEQRVEQGEWHDVIWGNHDAIDRRLTLLGKQQSLLDWWIS